MAFQNAAVTLNVLVKNIALFLEFPSSASPSATKYIPPGLEIHTAAINRFNTIRVLFLKQGIMLSMKIERMIGGCLK